MSEENLFTAARRAVRDFNIDMNKGGIITVETQRSMEILNREYRKEEARLKSTVSLSVFPRRPTGNET